jgi:hypothetical protein
MDRPLPLKKLRAILARYGVSEDRKRGKGSHTMFLKQFEDGTYRIRCQLTQRMYSQST